MGGGLLMPTLLGMTIVKKRETSRADDIMFLNSIIAIFLFAMVSVLVNIYYVVTQFMFMVASLCFLVQSFYIVHLMDVHEEIEKKLSGETYQIWEGRR
jgi:hypothetical protein